jgi:hypothetical protein
MSTKKCYRALATRYHYRGLNSFGKPKKVKTTTFDRLSCRENGRKAQILLDDLVTGFCQSKIDGAEGICRGEAPTIKRVSTQTVFQFIGQAGKISWGLAMFFYHMIFIDTSAFVRGCFQPNPKKNYMFCTSDLNELDP